MNSASLIASIFLYAATLLYAAAGILSWRKLMDESVSAQNKLTSNLMMLIASAVLLHGLHIFILWLSDGINFGLSQSASLVVFFVTLLLWVTALYRPVVSLATLVMPTATIILAVTLIWSGPTYLPKGNRLLFNTHWVVAVSGFAMIALAVAQALLLAKQESSLRQHHTNKLLDSLPPIMTMDRLLFQFITSGFILLSITLITGIFFSHSLFGKAFVFNHHVILSIGAWLIFAILLTGRRLAGWRGNTAVRWTLGGFLVLALGYFGSKFVLEILLQRPG